MRCKIAGDDLIHRQAFYGRIEPPCLDIKVQVGHKHVRGHPIADLKFATRFLNRGELHVIQVRVRRKGQNQDHPGEYTEHEKYSNGIRESF